MRSKFAFTSWSLDPLFEGQQLQNGQISAIGSIANADQHKNIIPILLMQQVLWEKQIFPLSYGHVTHFLKVSNPKTDKNKH